MKINEKVIAALQSCNNAAIFVHVNPDGDCLGSASALKQTLHNLNKKADIFCDDTILNNYDFLPHIKSVNKPECSKYDIAIAVDCSELSRMGKYADFFKKIDNTIKIDHHKTNEKFAKINVVEPVSSTCLILYYYIKNLISLDANIACALYAGISSDTGSFMHSNTTYLDHLIASELLLFNFDTDTANYLLFKRKTKPQIMLTKQLYNNIKYYFDGKLAISYLSRKDFEASNTTRAHTNGFTEIVNNIEGVCVGITICEERKGLYSISMRSKKGYDVSELASKFGGGGHARAAGCNVFGHLNTVVKKLTLAFEELITENCD